VLGRHGPKVFSAIVLLIVALAGIRFFQWNEYYGPGGRLVGHRYYDIAIDFDYGGHPYHRTWVYECDLHEFRSFMGDGGFNSISSRNGVATKLPDGSAVLFRFRDEVCGPNLIGWLLFGLPQSSERGRGSIASSLSQKYWAGRMDDPDHEFPHAAELVSPVTYWFDRAENPTRVEACIFPECSRDPRARIRLLKVTGGPSSAGTASPIDKDLPLFADIRADQEAGLAFVGYGCWVIPAHSLQPYGIHTPERLVDMASFASGEGRGDGIFYEMSFHGVTLLNARAWRRRSQMMPMPLYIPEDQPGVLSLKTPEADWYRSCRRFGSTVGVDRGPGDPAMPLVLTQTRKPLGSPTWISADPNLKLYGGAQGGTTLRETGRWDPVGMSTVAADGSDNLWIAEAHVLTTNLSPD